MEILNLIVEGMSCSHCENAVKKAVSALNGVDMVDVALSQKKVIVQYDPHKTTMDEIKDAIEDQGYEVKF